jgi:hypothetical protein
VQFIDNDRLDPGEKTRCVRRLPKQQRLNRFRSDEGDTGGSAQQPRLRTLGGIAVPFREWERQALAEQLQSAELVVDQRLERADV